MSGRVLHFYLAGINNQNFLMRDEETASWWQQASGKAISGPLQGNGLDPVYNDELTFGAWKEESPGGQVLLPVKKDEKYYESNWEPDVAKLPVVISFKGNGMSDRDVIIGIELSGEARAYPLSALSSKTPIVDHLGELPFSSRWVPMENRFVFSAAAWTAPIWSFFLRTTALRGPWWIHPQAASGTSRAARSRVPPPENAWRKFSS